MANALSRDFLSPRASALLGPLIGVLLLSGTAHARRSAAFAYPEARVWTSVVRLVRVDMSTPISEKDKDSGYILFEYKSDGRSYAGSAEVVAAGETGRPQVRVTFHVAGMPSYVEQMMLDKLRRKLTREFGPPKDAPEPEPSPEPQPDRDPSPPDQAPSQPPANGTP